MPSREAVPNFDAHLDRLFRLTGADVRSLGRPFLGLPGSIDLAHNGVVLAVPEGPMVPLWREFDRRACGGLAAIKALRTPYYRRAGYMLLMAHDAARTTARAICTVPWWTDEDCRVWTSQAAEAGSLLCPGRY